MAQYRKTALVEAEQFLPAKGQIPAGVYSSERADPRKNPLADWMLNTLEGPHVLRSGDYICTGAAGEKWNVEQSIFEATYELASTTPSQVLDAATVERFREAIVTIVGRCEALEDEAADELEKEQPEHAAGFYRGQKTTAKSLRNHLADLARPISLATEPYGGKGA